MQIFIILMSLMMLSAVASPETINYETQVRGISSDEVTMVTKMPDFPELDADALQELRDSEAKLRSTVDSIIKRQVEEIFYKSKKEVARIVMDIEGNILSESGVIPDGIVKEYYDDGKLKSEAMYKDNRLTGIRKSYYTNGKIEAILNYEAGKKNGEFKTYYEDGQISMEGTNRAGNPQGVVKQYHRNGKLSAESTQEDETGNILMKVYNEQGSFLSEVHLKKDGTIISNKVYDEKGELIGETVYKNGIDDKDGYVIRSFGEIVNSEDFDKKGNLIKETGKEK